MPLTEEEETEVSRALSFNRYCISYSVKLDVCDLLIY